MAQIYLIPPSGVTIYGKSYVEGVYGESEFTQEQMEKLIQVGVATEFSIASPHDENSPQNTMPDRYSPIHTILMRAEYWKLPFESDLQRRQYFALRGIFGVADYYASGVMVKPARSK